MLKRVKEILLIGLAVLILVIIAIVASSRPDRGIKREKPLTATVIPVAGGLMMISPVFRAEDRSIYFFDQKEIRVAKVNVQGQVTHLSDYLSGIEQAVWSPDFSKVLLRNINDLDINPEAIAQSPLLRADQENQAVLTWLYDISGKKLTFVSARYNSVLWMTDESIFYRFAGAEQGAIRVANPDGTSLQVLSRIDDVAVDELTSWIPSKGIIFVGGRAETDHHLFLKRLDDDRSTLLIKDIQKIIARGSQVVYTQAEDTSNLYLFDVARGKSFVLWDGKEPIRNFALSGTKILGLTSREAFVLDLSAQRYYPLSLEFPTEEIDMLISTDRAETFYFTAAETLYRLNLE